VQRFGVPQLLQDCLRSHTGGDEAGIGMENEEDSSGIAAREQVRERRVRPCFYSPDRLSNARFANTLGWPALTQTCAGFPESTRTECVCKSETESDLSHPYSGGESESTPPAHPVNRFDWTPLNQSLDLDPTRRLNERLASDASDTEIFRRSLQT
jgi:hypothetical protein